MTAGRKDSPVISFAKKVVAMASQTCAGQNPPASY